MLQVGQEPIIRLELGWTIPFTAVDISFIYRDKNVNRRRVYARLELDVS
jgi:hypothetical protein